MNLNKIKKINVKFPNFVNINLVVSDAIKKVPKFKEIQNINARIYSELYAGDSGMQVGARNLPHIEGFNCTFLNDQPEIGYTKMQFTFASGEEKKVFRLIEKHGGEIMPIRTEMQQFGKTETDQNNSGKEHSYENVNELLTPSDT